MHAAPFMHIIAICRPPPLARVTSLLTGRLVVESQNKATVWCMVEASSVKRQAAPRQLLQGVRRTASRKADGRRYRKADCSNLAVARSVHCRLCP